jgi:hypothetical protein
MSDSAASSPRWLLLIHQLPPKPDYLRVKLRRRLHRLGAAPIKSTVYVLPATEESYEDFTWLVREIEADGGSAVLCEASFVDGITDEEVEAMLNAHVVDASSEQRQSAPERVAPGRTWVTREGVHVDRIASAWLIRRFIDPKATFKFVPSRGYTPRAGELRFDMFKAEYTHEGDRCTFETLLARFGLGDRALAALGEIVHDIDCKDERFGRAETRGVATIVRGIVENNDTDADRVKRGEAVFDDLYASLRKARA